MGKYGKVWESIGKGLGSMVKYGKPCEIMEKHGKSCEIVGKQLY